MDDLLLNDIDDSVLEHIARTHFNNIVYLGRADFPCDALNIDDPPKPIYARGIVYGAKRRLIVPLVVQNSLALTPPLHVLFLVHTSAPKSLLSAKTLRALGFEERDIGSQGLFPIQLQVRFFEGCATIVSIVILISKV